MANDIQLSGTTSNTLRLRLRSCLLSLLSIAYSPRSVNISMRRPGNVCGLAFIIDVAEKPRTEVGPVFSRPAKTVWFLSLGGKGERVWKDISMRANVSLQETIREKGSVSTESSFAYGEFVERNHTPQTGIVEMSQMMAMNGQYVQIPNTPVYLHHFNLS